jgi:hypothetical protein
MRQIIIPDILAAPPLELFAFSVEKSATPLIDELLRITKEVFPLEPGEPPMKGADYAP